jgi:hypothetical protein
MYCSGLYSIKVEEFLDLAEKDLEKLPKGLTNQGFGYHLSTV